MKQIIFALLICTAVTNSFAQNTDKEKVVMAYYSGFENHNWNTVANQFADGFTFTSPNNDDHISLEKFKEKCWPTNKYVKKVNYIKWAEKGNDVFLLVEIITPDGTVVRNVDYYSFSDGKIKSIETYFGPGAWFPGNKK
jgi:hypothetical protein